MSARPNKLTVGNNLYLGSSDGVVYWYTIDGSGPSSEVGASSSRIDHRALSSFATSTLSSRDDQSVRSSSFQ